MRKLLYSFLFFIYTKSLPQRLFIPNLRLLCVGMFFVVSFANAATYYSRRTGDWTANSTWSTSSGGGQVASGVYPKSGDIVIIERGYTVTINANVACGTLQVGSPGIDGGNDYGAIDFSGSYTLVVSGNSTFGGNGATARKGTITFSGGSVFNTGSLNLGNTNTGVKGAGIIDMSSGGTMNISGNIVVTTVTGNSWNPGTGTVIMSATNNLPSTLFTSFNNLTISAGTTTFSRNTTINGTLSIASIANLGTGFIHTANKLILGGGDTVAGSWGSSTSLADNQNNTYFSAFNGIVNVSASNCSLASFTLTGGGGYCGATAGAPLGLSGSESGVNYQLYNGTTAVGSPVPGTGSALSFGTANTIGEYTVVASKAFCKLTFGPVSIFNYSTPPTPTATVVKTTCPTSADGSITITNALKPASLAFTSASNQYVNLGTPLLSNRAAFTIEGWVKFNRATAISANRMSLFGQNDAVEIGFINGNLICYTLNGGQVDMSLSTYYPNDNDWHHIAVTADGKAGGIKIYVDGLQKVSGGSAVTNYGSSTDPTRFGWGTVDASGGGYTGEVFKLGFWNKALSQTEVTNMASGFVVYNASQTGLLAGFSFNEGAGGTVASVGSAGLQPSNLVNAPVWTDPYSYSWTSNPAGFTSTAINITSLTARTYNLTTSLKGCTNTGSWVVTSNNPTLTASVSIAASPSGAICSGTPVTFTATPTDGGTAPSYQWKKNGTNVGTGTTYSSSTLANNDVVTCVMISNASPCLTGSPATSNPITMTVNPNLPASVSIVASPSGAICSGTPVTFTATPTYGGAAPVYQWYKGTTAISGATNSTYTSNALANSDVITVQMTSNATCATGSPATSGPITMTVNSKPSAPLTSQVNLSCGGLGSITLSSLPTNNWKVYLNDQSGAHQYNRQNTETDLTINNLPVGTYNFTVEDVTSTCISSVASVEIIDITTNTTWNGSAWSNGAPDGSKSVTISSVLPNQPFPKPVPSSPISFTACSLTITATDGDVIIPSEMTLTVTNGITSNGKLVFESGSSLLQGANAVNSGNISYKRKVDLTRYDVVYWGSPVTDANMTMAKFSPNTLWDKYHYWDAANGQWILNSFGTKVMKEGEGYSIRAPQNFSLTIPDTFEGIFVGEPNNGDLSVPVLENKLNLIGNPYPSPISAKELMLANKTQLGSLYFWSHNSPPQIIPGTNTFQYISSDFVVFNGTGSTRVNDDPATEFKGFIGAGQAFFTISPAGATAIKFNNDLRKASSQNTQFYKPSEASKTESNRLWLNIANSQGAFKQILIGYVEGATNGIDFSYDATTRGGTAYIDFYSISESRKLTIQGRALPFDDTDVVPLGYKSGVDEKGDRNFTISIDHADGFFATQAVYLEDKALGKIIDLRKENYTFFSLAGSNSTRFSIRYTNKTLGTDDFENLENTVLVSVKDKAVNITSSKETIKEVNVYNVGAQLLYSNNKVNASDLQIKNLHSSDQVLLVKITLENGHTFTKKVIFSNL